MPILSNSRHEPTFDEFESLLRFEPSTGRFFWRVNRYRVEAGAPAGQPHPSGYWMIGVRGRRYLAHRLAWLFSYGRWPEATVDHINGDRRDNRPSNLREASASQNTMNGKRRSTNTSGFKGVSWRPDQKKWRAYIVKDGRQTSLGSFDSPEKAHAAYASAAALMHGEFARTV